MIKELLKYAPKIYPKHIKSRHFEAAASSSVVQKQIAQCVPCFYVMLQNLKAKELDTFITEKNAHLNQDQLYPGWPVLL